MSVLASLHLLYHRTISKTLILKKSACICAPSTTHVFITNNPEQVSQNTSLSLQIIGIHGLVQSFGSKTEALEAKVDSRLEDRAVIELLRDNIWLQSEHLELLKKG